MSAFSNKFTWSVGNWTTTKPTAAYTSSDIGIVNYANSSGNADTVDGLHLYTRNLGINGSSWTFASTANSNATTHIYAATSAGTSGQILKSTGGTPTWMNQSDLIAGKVTCTVGTADIFRPIVLTNESNQLYYNTKIKGNYSTGKIQLSGIEIEDAAGNIPLIRFGSANKNSILWKVYSNDTTYANQGVYGFDMTYFGTGSGNTNRLVLHADNQNSATKVEALSITQDGVVTFSKTISGSINGNADTVDGYHASAFATSEHNHDGKYLRKDTNDSTPYQYTFTKTNDHAIRVGTVRGTAVGSQTGEYMHLYERVAIGSPSGWGSRPAPSYGLATYGGAWLATDTGNVGIGTTSPSYKLDVNGQIHSSFASNNGNPCIMINPINDIDWCYGIEVLATKLTAGHRTGAYWAGKTNSTNNAICMSYYHAGDGSEDNRLIWHTWGSGDKMMLTANGKVGIGATPSYKLHVAGDIYTTTGFKKNGSSDNYILLGGGGHKALSDFSMAHSHPYLPLSGGTMTGVIKSTYTSSTWINGVTNAILKGEYTGYGAILSMPVKDGRVSFSSYPANDNNIYFGYATTAQINAGTNSLNKQMYWDAANNNLHAGVFTGYLSGNASTATKWATARTLTIGNTGKTVDGSGNVSWTLAEIGAATSGHTHTLSLASDTGTSSITLAHGGKYKLTAGGNSIIFTLPTDNNTNPANYYWANIKVSAASSTSTAPQFGKVKINTTSSTYQLNVNGDSYVTNWCRTGKGLYLENSNIYFAYSDKSATTAEIDLLSNNEFCWGANSNTLYFNYKQASRNATTVTKYVWNAGSSSTYATHVTGDIILGYEKYQIKRTGRVSDWSNGRNAAMIRMTSTGQYSAIISIKTHSGSWEMGNGNPSRDYLYFSYVSDTNFNNANPNTPPQVYFDSDACVYATHFYEHSDIRYKKILRNISINSNTIATLPLFDFKWIENNIIGTGTSAQAVQQILPNLVSGTDRLTLDYGVLGTIAGITACKELVKQKSELQQLKEKIKELEDKLRKYENT